MRTLKRNPVTKQTRDRARFLRRRSTSAEQRLWKILRNSGAEVKFRRQQPIGPFIVDFYSPELALVIEVDGDAHAGDDAILRDREREEYLRAQGLYVHRYLNRDVMTNLDGVLKDLCDRIRLLRGPEPPTVPPYPKGGETR